MRTIFLSFTTFLLILIVGCSDGGNTPTSSNNNNGTDTTGTNPTDTIVSFANDIQPIIQANGCLAGSCHGNTTISGGLNLGNGTYSDIRNATGLHGAFIDSGNAAGSNFYLKVSPTPPYGARMPLSLPPLSTAQITMIRDWINQGALDN